MNPNYLDFEQPIAELDAKIRELRLMDNEAGLNINEEIARLEAKSMELTRSIFGNLTAWQINQIARHPQRPYTFDYIKHMLTDFTELHGDRAFADDGAIVGGMARLDGIPVMVIGQQTPGSTWVSRWTIAACAAWPCPESVVQGSALYPAAKPRRIMAW